MKPCKSETHEWIVTDKEWLFKCKKCGALAMTHEYWEKLAFSCDHFGDCERSEEE